MSANYLSNIKLLEVFYDLDSPSNEGSLLVCERNTGEELLCCDVDCGEHLDYFKIGHDYEAFFSAFGMISHLNEDGIVPEIEKNQYRGVIRMNAKIVDIRDEWYICDAGFYVYAMPITNMAGFKKGGRVTISAGLRVELVIN